MQIKKCRKCREEKTLENFFPDRLGKGGVGSTCRDCKNPYSVGQAKKRPQKRGHLFSEETKVERGHKFSKKVKQEIFERDGCCIIPGCSTREGTAHHFLYKTSEKIYDGTQNDIDKGVWLCGKHHCAIHAGKTHLNDFCKLYIQKMYGNRSENS